MARRFLSCSARSRLLLLIVPSNYLGSPNWRGVCWLTLAQKSRSNIVSARLGVTLPDSLTDYRSNWSHSLRLLKCPSMLPLKSPLILSPFIGNLTLHGCIFRSLLLTCPVSTSKEPDSTAQQSTANHDCGKPDKKHRQGCNETCQCTAANKRSENQGNDQQ